MRVKLTVTQSEKGGEERTYILEQDPITIGRAGTCDLPLDDPERVVSKEHAQIRREGDALRIFDLGSKNQTFVNGDRVGQSGLSLKEGDTVTLGPFEVLVSIDDAVMVANDLDRTVFGTAFVNPFRDPAKGVAEALAELRSSYAGLDYGHRAEALRAALSESLGDDAPAVSAVVLGNVPPAVVEAAPEAAPPKPAPASAPNPQGDAGNDVLQALATAAARLVSIPGQFRHEFLGHTVIHAPETAFLFDADVDALIRHLTPEDESARAGRQELLLSAANAVVRHHQALLEGYRAAIREGAEKLLDAVDPDKLDAEGGLAGGLMPGAKERALLDRIRERLADLRGESFAATERRVYQPVFSQAYLDALARMSSAPSMEPIPAAVESPGPGAPAAPYAPPAAELQTPFQPTPPADPYAAPPHSAPYAEPSPETPFSAPADPFSPPAANPYAPAPADPFLQQQAAPPPDPYAPLSADPYAPADPFTPPPADPFAPPPANPFAPASSDPYAPPPADPYAPPPADPYAPPPADPYAPPPADPYAAPPADPYAAAPVDPNAPVTPDQPPGAPPDPFAAPGADPFASAPDPFADPAPDPFEPPPASSS